jgi:hypothetical protein
MPYTACIFNKHSLTVQNIAPMLGPMGAVSTGGGLTPPPLPTPSYDLRHTDEAVCIQPLSSLVGVEGQVFPYWCV